MTMLFFKPILFFLLFFCFDMACAEVLETEDRVFRSIWHPSYQCNRLAYCDGPDCGKPVADRFCQLLGYDCSSEDVIAHNVGLTHALSNRERCTGWACDGFLLITCATHFNHPKPYHYREKEFVVPRFNAYRVAWCYKDDEGCGARAANAFCTHLGFLKATYFEKECQVNATKAIGNQELCFGPDCEGFKTIVCFR